MFTVDGSGSMAQENKWIETSLSIKMFIEKLKDGDFVAAILFSD